MRTFLIIFMLLATVPGCATDDGSDDDSPSTVADDAPSSRAAAVPRESDGSGSTAAFSDQS